LKLIEIEVRAHFTSPALNEQKCTVALPKLSNLSKWKVGIRAVFKQFELGMRVALTSAELAHNRVANEGGLQ
jgi:hypothetical protein